MSRASLRAIADAADALARLARAACDDHDDPDEFLTLEEARTLAKFKTTRPIRDAGRAGHLTLYGTQRTRTVKRGDLMRWLEDHRSPIVVGEATPDIMARMRRLGKARAARPRSKPTA